MYDSMAVHRDFGRLVHSMEGESPQSEAELYDRPDVEERLRLSTRRSTSDRITDAFQAICALLLARQKRQSLRPT